MLFLLFVRLAVQRLTKFVVPLADESTTTEVLRLAKQAIILYDAKVAGYPKYFKDYDLFKKSFRKEMGIEITSEDDQHFAYSNREFRCYILIVFACSSRLAIIA